MEQQFDDTYLVARAQGGHLGAFEALVERYQARVYRVALRMLANPHDAQDAAQDAFVQAWKGLAGFRGDSAFSTWLYRIITNRCLKFLRDRPRTQPLAETHEAPANRPDQVAEANARRDALHAAIAA
ncbi:MAG TPA: sigma-70 family RNA polymerase sigma factor, partial [Propionibacteriaceae bacterium]|nr:sigma-70 family RNA polymerase sigma factor [Propionibacteriaceae bacterium]